MKKIPLLVWVLIFLIPSVGKSSGETGAAFLKVGVGAKAIGMGEAVTAYTDGVESLYWNPAGVRQSKWIDVMFTHNPLVEGSQFNHAAGTWRFNKFSLGFGYHAFQHNQIDGFDSVGNATGKFDASDRVTLGALSFGGEKFSIGATGKIVATDINGFSDNSLAGDAGVQFQSFKGNDLKHALVVRNVGSPLTLEAVEEDLPLTMTFGNALHLGSKLIFTLDLGSIKGTGFVGSSGIEWKPFGEKKDLLSFRGGYNTRRNEIEGLSGASFGLGFKLSQFNFDYAWVPMGDLGQSHALSLVWRVPKWVPKLSERANFKEKKKRFFRGRSKSPRVKESVFYLKTGKKVRGVVIRDYETSIILKTRSGKIKIKKSDIIQRKRGRRRRNKLGGF